MINIKALKDAARTIRGLSIDAIEKAGCGHPGLPLGCAEIGAYLFGHALQFNPTETTWLNRDKFILSAGHGSMLLYSCLHLAGFDCSIEDLRQFRQKNAKTAGHPEYGHLAGVETTTGPLGQGFATAVGLALANQLLKVQFNLNSLINSKIVVLAGDGCIMEGVCAEAASLAGHLALDNIIVFYDSNDISLDGPLSDSMSENTQKRFEAYGWQVETINGHEFLEIDQAYQKAKKANKPTLIIAKTIIGKGAPNVEGSADVHGKALGKKEAELCKKNIGLDPKQFFEVSEEVKTFFKKQSIKQKKAYEEWSTNYKVWEQSHPKEAEKIKARCENTVPKNIEKEIEKLEIKENIATRASSQAIIQKLHDLLPEFIGGSADLSCSDSTKIKNSSDVNKDNFNGKNIKYGAREFAMADVAAGLALQGIYRPFIGTFLMFSDYMKNAIRLTALMKLPVIYQFTHDSILLGEDGPTHQPVEQLAGLRAIPNLAVIRPADSNEVKGAWLEALKTKSQATALILSRQSAKDLEQTSMHDVKKGAYIVKDVKEADCAIIGTGTEVDLALKVANELEVEGYQIRVISMPCQCYFDAQATAYKNKIIDKTIELYVSIEAASSKGWHQYIGRDGLCISVDEFGHSANADDLRDMYGFTVEAIKEKIITRLTQVKQNETLYTT
ncbi:MAG: transketolase [bacterium]